MLERPVSAAAQRQRAQRIRDALELLRQFTIELHNDRLMLAVTAHYLTDIEAHEDASIEFADLSREYKKLK